MIVAGIILLLWLITRAIQGKLADRSLIFRFLIDIDIFFCALILGRADMTISADCGLSIRSDGPWPLVWLGRCLNAISHNHCELAIADDISRARAAIDILLGD